MSKSEIEDQVVIVMQLVRIFSRLDEFATRIGEKGGIQLILQAMQAFPYCMQLQINCSACLANLASIEANREIMLDTGCIKYVLDNMSKFMKDPAVQAEICATLANLACHKVNAKYIIENNGCMLILKAMRLHMNHVDLQIQAFHAFSSLGKSCLHILEREDFLGLSMKSLTIHQQNVDLASGLHRQTVYDNSGIMTIINSMRRGYSKGENEEEFDDRQTPEPVLYSRANSKIQCSKPLLLQLFGSVALLNLSECEKCRETIIDSGGIQCIFEASIRVKEQSDLWFIIYYFTKCGENKTIYMVPKLLPTLREITKIVVTNNFLEKLVDYDVEEDRVSGYLKYRSYLDGAIDKHLLSCHMREEVLSSIPCYQCRKACYESHVRAFEITSTITRNSLMYSFCTLNCAKMHKSYQDKSVFSYTPQTE
ncbi:hypothetical protein HDV06_002844 [Boothiomyces sp. JEL0866]|nr:hypothetical protein HDV06_002844 [Boothiomyces sp. JEL0866]